MNFLSATPDLASTSFQGQGGWMFWLIEANLASTGKFDLGDGTPSLLLNGRALDASVCEGGHLGFQIVAHEIELVSFAVS